MTLTIRAMGVAKGPKMAGTAGSVPGSALLSVVDGLPSRHSARFTSLHGSQWDLIWHRPDGQKVEVGKYYEPSDGLADLEAAVTAYDLENPFPAAK